MERMLFITDVTRMRSPRVCVGCVDDQGCNVRPKFEWGPINEDWLYEDGKVVIRPFAVVIMDLIQPDPHLKAPHTEDWIVSQDVKRFRGLLTEAQRMRLFGRVSDLNVASIFGAEIQHNPGNYIRENEGNRSLGTVRIAQVNFVQYEQQINGNWGYHITFTDEAGAKYKLAVTDLAFHHYLDVLRTTQGYSTGKIGAVMQKCLAEKDAVYLRIGLTRPTWAAHPHCCFLQINGVYSFPDYLEGRCFADFENDD